MFKLYLYSVLALICIASVLGAETHNDTGSTSSSRTPSPPRIRTTVENEYAGAHGLEYRKKRVTTNLKAGAEFVKGTGCTIKGVCRSIVHKSDTQDREKAKGHFDKAKELRNESHTLGEKHKELKNIQFPSPEDARARVQQNVEARRQRVKAKAVHT
ncbi:uncharacterized protein FA14DRAFT_154472 [Meira miltonrushii]|uniref:Uncharacterized protein n=1 Tax=Meira miltonrushii TaxID=1280837 RepID=A0A316VBV1_9BASI|nr:uncharacterized protein FA14DRAFT_154472 [Meira miltonrushii]PWN35042.1 hypothetical protein FA14DRAFT_154472 [Meira miltonrushii]